MASEIMMSLAVADCIVQQREVSMLRYSDGSPTSRLFHIVAINERSGKQTLCTGYPMPHAQACNNMSRFSYHPARRMQLVEFTGSAS